MSRERGEALFSMLVMYSEKQRQFIMTHFGENAAFVSQITDPISLSYSRSYSTVKSKLLCRHSKN